MAYRRQSWDTAPSKQAENLVLVGHTAHFCRENRPSDGSSGIMTEFRNSEGPFATVRRCGLMGLLFVYVPASSFGDNRVDSRLACPQLSSSGKTLSYLTLERGSAIISVTVSRQIL